MTGKKIDLFDIVDEWFIPIALIELFVIAQIAIISCILKLLGVI